MQRKIAHLLKRPVGRPSRQPKKFYAGFRRGGGNDFLGGKAFQSHLWRLESTLGVVTEARDRAIRERSV